MFTHTADPSGALCALLTSPDPAHRAQGMELLDALRHTRSDILRGCDLRGARLKGADLRGLDLRDTRLEHVGLQGADLRGCDLRGAALDSARRVAPMPPMWREIVASRELIGLTAVLAVVGITSTDDIPGAVLLALMPMVFLAVFLELLRLLAQAGFTAGDLRRSIQAHRRRLQGVQWDRRTRWPSRWVAAVVIGAHLRHRLRTRLRRAD